MNTGVEVGDFIISDESACYQVCILRHINRDDCIAIYSDGVAYYRNSGEANGKRIPPRLCGYTGKHLTQEKVLAYVDWYIEWPHDKPMP